MAEAEKNKEQAKNEESTDKEEVNKEKTKKDDSNKDYEPSPIMPQLNIEEIGKGFIDNYYEIFSNDRTKLEILYRDPSCLSFEGQGYQGTKKIMNKLRV